MRDSYERFLSEGYISKEQLFDFGIRETIYAPLEAARAGWEKLKRRIKEDQRVYIRGFGRDAKKTQLYKEFYKHVLCLENVVKDPSNNAEPTKVIRDMTGYSKEAGTSKLIRNYQVSHIFGRTKNVFAFTAPWNIVYIPKLLDPLTGHEARGDLADEYKDRFTQCSYLRFKPLIDDYNQLISDKELRRRVESYLEKIIARDREPGSGVDKLVESVSIEFTPIAIPVK